MSRSRGRRIKRTTALVITHLSSLDDFAKLAVAIQGDDEAARNRAFNIERAVMKHRGPVFILDQDRPLDADEPASEIRRELMNALRFRTDVQWILFNENVQNWKWFLNRLAVRLLAEGVTDIVIGGFWMGTDCTSKIHDYLSRGFRVRVRLTLVGCEDDLPPPERTDLPDPSSNYPF